MNQALRRHFWIVLLGGGVILGSFILEPAGPYQMRLPGAGPFPEMSPFHAVTGLPGPTCGLTRSFVNTAHLRMSDGFHAHMLGPILFLGLLGVWASSVLRIWKLRRGVAGAANVVHPMNNERPPDRWRPFIIPLVIVFFVTWITKLLLGWY